MLRRERDLADRRTRPRAATRRRSTPVNVAPTIARSVRIDHDPAVPARRVRRSSPRGLPSTGRSTARTLSPGVQRARERVPDRAPPAAPVKITPRRRPSERSSTGRRGRGRRPARLTRPYACSSARWRRRRRTPRDAWDPQCPSTPTARPASSPSDSSPSRVDVAPARSRAALGGSGARPRVERHRPAAPSRRRRSPRRLSSTSTPDARAPRAFVPGELLLAGDQALDRPRGMRHAALQRRVCLRHLDAVQPPPSTSSDAGIAPLRRPGGRGSASRRPGIGGTQRRRCPAGQHDGTAARRLARPLASDDLADRIRPARGSARCRGPRATADARTSSPCDDLIAPRRATRRAVQPPRRLRGPGTRRTSASACAGRRQAPWTACMRRRSTRHRRSSRSIRATDDPPSELHRHATSPPAPAPMTSHVELARWRRARWSPSCGFRAPRVKLSRHGALGR